MEFKILLLIALVYGSPLVARFSIPEDDGLTLYRRQSAGLDPALADAFTSTLVEGIGQQMSEVMAKAKELDASGSESDKERKMGELESSINDIAVRMSKELMSRNPGPKNSDAGPVAEKEVYVDKDPVADAAVPEDTTSDDDVTETKKSGSESESNNSYSGDKGFKEDLKAEMKKMKEELKALRRRAEPQRTYMTKADSDRISAQVAEALASKLPEDQKSDAPLVKAVATTITEQVMKNVASQYK